MRTHPHDRLFQFFILLYISTTLLTFGLSTLSDHGVSCECIRPTLHGCRTQHGVLYLRIKTDQLRLRTDQLRLRGGEAQDFDASHSSLNAEKDTGPAETAEPRQEIGNYSRPSTMDPSERLDDDSSLSDEHLISLGRKSLDSKDFSGAAAYFSSLVQRQV